ncbi:MAG: AMP-binding protein [Spirochaetaceae bacterium]|jgi:long-chain acyl-CoA synthetase|nr:AMP-binding protein [Spirochaetaceae bacterium]
MLDPKEYMVDWEDLPYPNFIAWLQDLEGKYVDNQAIYYREGKQKTFSIWTFKRMAAECRRFARGLRAAGLKKGDRVVLWAENRPEWIFIWLGTVITGCTIVPVDFLVSEDECYNIIKITAAKAAVFSAQKEAFAQSKRVKDTALAVSIIITGDEFKEFGKNAAAEQLPTVEEIDEQDPCSIVFTSGTTGFAKGVVLSHKGIIANVNAALLMLEPKTSDIFINVLPLHHTYPTTCSFLSPLSFGVPMIIVERLVGQIVIDDIRDARGTFLIAVPLLYDKVMAAINAKYRKLPFFIRWLLNILRKKALKEAKQGNPEFGRKALKVIRKKAGLESITIMVAGGGALSPKTADFFDSFGFNIVHGYGISENSPLVSVNTPRYKNNVSVGLAVKDTQVRIVDQNDDTCSLAPGETGEIVVKSPSLMLGYYENPKATAEVFTKDGFLKTGDLGYIDNDGFIYINGRKKNLIVSSGGKNIYPEEIEEHFAGSRVIGEILVVGRKDSEAGEYIFAAIYPNYEALCEDYGECAQNAEFVQGLVKKEIEAVNRPLPVYKKISHWILRESEFEKNAQKKIRRFLYKDYENP